MSACDALVPGTDGSASPVRTVVRCPVAMPPGVALDLLVAHPGG